MKDREGSIPVRRSKASESRITSYNVCYTKLLRLSNGGQIDHLEGLFPPLGCQLVLFFNRNTFV